MVCEFTKSLTAESITRDEKPVLTFRRYALAFHLAARWEGPGEPQFRGETHAERALESYEDDMLLYAHRDQPPFRTRVVAPRWATIRACFPERLGYESEGRGTTLIRSGRPAREFSVALGLTVFESSHLGVLTLVITPARAGSEHDEDSKLDEYDVIKLEKLWEGGESVPFGEVEGLDRWLTGESDKPRSLGRLAEEAFDGWRPVGYDANELVTSARRGYRVGTVQLELSRPGVGDLFDDLHRLRQGRTGPEMGSESWKRAVAVGGLLQGLLDFQRIGEDELADVFADVEVDPKARTLRGFHKGTLLRLVVEEDEADDDDRPPPIRVDPYLAIPNVVLLHNEHRLKSARLRVHDLSERQRTPVRDLRHRATIPETEEGLGDLARMLAQHLPNVFHYVSERELQKLGARSRGLDDLETFVRLRKDDLTSVLQSRVRRRDRWTAVIGIAVGVVTGFLVQQAISGHPTWIIFVTSVAIFGLFLALRDRIF